MSLYFYQLEERRESIKYMLKWFTCRKIRIKSVNVLNDCFHVWYSGPFATINGFRLGRHPLTKVDWSEVNAALGEITLLLVSVGFNFTRYILVPQGSHSKLKSADDSRQQYHLYIDESFSLLPRRNFNQAISALLVCAEELGNFVANQDPVLRYPYLIQNSQIDSLSCLHSTHEETWTRSLKFLLTDMKWTIMWVAKHTVNNIIEDDI